MGIELEGFLIVNSNSGFIRVRSVYSLQLNLADVFIYDISDDLGLRQRETISWWQGVAFPGWTILFTFCFTFKVKIQLLTNSLR